MLKLKFEKNETAHSAKCLNNNDEQVKEKNADGHMEPRYAKNTQATAIPVGY